MKKIMFIFVMFFMINQGFSTDIVKFQQIHPLVKDLQEQTDDRINIFNGKILKQEFGWILFIERLDMSTDIVYVEMDKPSAQTDTNKADLYFHINKKISARLAEYQMIYFNGIIIDYNINKNMFYIKDVFLHGIMK